MAKLIENAYRDVNIAFANELSMICDRLRHRRLGGDRAGQPPPARQHPAARAPGVGGHCIAVDPWFIVDAAPEQARLIRTAREVNDGKPHWVLERVEEAMAETRPNAACAAERTIACLGLAFKADIDDLRESPALAIVRAFTGATPARCWRWSRMSPFCPRTSPASSRSIPTPRWSAPRCRCCWCGIPPSSRRRRGSGPGMRWSTPPA